MTNAGIRILQSLCIAGNFLSEESKNDDLQLDVSSHVMVTENFCLFCK